MKTTFGLLYSGFCNSLFQVEVNPGPAPNVALIRIKRTAAH